MPGRKKVLIALRAETLSWKMKHTTNTRLPARLCDPEHWQEQPSFLKLSEPQRAKAALRNRPAAQSAPSRGRHRLALLVCAAALFLGSYYLVSRFVAPTLVVHGSGMAPAFRDGERIIFNRWSYFRRTPERGDVVVLKRHGRGDCEIKRVIALPCDSVYVRGGQMLVNGTLVQESYLSPERQTFSPDMEGRLLVVGKNQYFVLADDRANNEANRSRFVRRSEIIGSIER